MRGILADNDIRGQMQILVGIFSSDAWQDVWKSLNLKVHTMEDLGLADDATDAVIWQACQSAQVVLLTGNRNKDGPDSLEATIH